MELSFSSPIKDAYVVKFFDKNNDAIFARLVLHTEADNYVRRELIYSLRRHAKGEMVSAVTSGLTKKLDEAVGVCVFSYNRTRV